MLVKVKCISELHKGMVVVTPLDHEAIVVKLWEDHGKQDDFERVDLKYTGSNYHRKWDNMVVLQPTQLRYYLE